MYIIIDTNAVNADLNLKNASIMKLTSKAKDEGYKVCFPKAVIEEMVKHYLENTSKAFKDLKRAAKILYDETEISVLNETEVEAAKSITDGYITKLRKRIKELNCEILKLPSRGQQNEILKKAVKRIKPFNSAGVGYQDATIWANIMDIMERYSEHEGIVKPKVILVSNNHTDFCNSDKFDLHEDLVEELDEIGVPEVAVKVVKTLEDASAELTIHTDKIISDETLAFFKDPVFASSIFRTKVEHMILNKLSFKSFNSSEIGLGDIFEDPTIDMMYEDFDYKDIEAEILSEEEISISLKVSLTCQLDVFVDKSEAYHIEEGMLSIYDHDWNNYYVAAQLEKRVWFEVNLITSNNFQEISSFEIEASEELNDVLDFE
ncbi:hypothetical protein CPT03_08375 [Pedobacter ginsengisoli]|uniref:DUF4935 domain-containing protein n=2 Tax=Pedobacter ginsengisoli TaxID=363852 RepID=A0A2D1U4F8_9SPHI|nr:hypothetical protein CPT03_08375 [Pedobacter ginsengisoli]